AFVWEAGVMIDLNNLLPPGSHWTLTDAGSANAGQIAGTGQLNGQQHAFLYTDNDGILGNGGGGVITDLGTLSRGGWSQATGLNGAGKVVGLAQAVTRGVTGNNAFLWTPKVANGTSGGLTNLGALSGLYSTAFGINDSGSIVGRSTYTPSGGASDSH